MSGLLHEHGFRNVKKADGFVGTQKQFKRCVCFVVVLPQGHRRSEKLGERKRSMNDSGSLNTVYVRATDLWNVSYLSR